MTTNLTEEKVDLPNEFDRIARHYDVIVGNEPNYMKHMRWSAERLVAPPNGRILDLCCGTGISTVALKHTYPQAEIVGLDASRGMLEVAGEKPELKGVRFVHGDAMDPEPAAGQGFDACFLSFGIRNLPDADVCLDHLHAILKPGGRICFHEYAVRHSLLSRMRWHKHWLTVILPGAIRTGTVKAHYYLWRSVNDFDGAIAFCQRLERHGFTHARYERMDGDVAGVLHSFIATRS
jgi:ubiquinone/menaquinone biosynthesis C-methylase UbiE